MKTKEGFNVAVKNSDEEFVDIDFTNDDLLRIFGVKVASLGFAQRRQIMYLYMKQMTMLIPPKMLTHNDSDSGDSESSKEEIKKQILVNPIKHLYGGRRIVHIEDGNRLIPVSIFIIGTDDDIIGIKVISYNDVSCEDKGFFLNLRQD
jgi:hypothetical protein